MRWCIALAAGLWATVAQGGSDTAGRPLLPAAVMSWRGAQGKANQRVDATPGKDDPPVLTVFGINPLTIDAAPVGSESSWPYEDEGAGCVDFVDGDISSQVAVHLNVNIHNPGVYHVQYACADSRGRVSRAQRTVVVHVAVATEEGSAHAVERDINNRQIEQRLKAAPKTMLDAMLHLAALAGVVVLGALGLIWASLHGAYRVVETIKERCLRVTDTFGITSSKPKGAKLPTTFLRPQFAAPLGAHADDTVCSNEQKYEYDSYEEEGHGRGHDSGCRRPQYGSSTGTGIQESVLDYSVAPDASCHRAAPVGYSNVNVNLSNMAIG